jgi:hypothetical protein
MDVMSESVMGITRGFIINLNLTGLRWLLSKRDMTDQAYYEFATVLSGGISRFTYDSECFTTEPPREDAHHRYMSVVNDRLKTQRGCQILRYVATVLLGAKPTR